MRPDADVDAGPVLVGLARAAIADRFGMAVWPPSQHGWLSEPGAAFVTLTVAGGLRGCIGSITADRSLRGDVIANARAAAFSDPRFPPVTAAELPRIRVEVSVLSSPEPVAFTSEESLLARLRPGVDGLIIEAGGRRAVFLPQVWASLPDPVDFLARLKHKGHISTLQAPRAQASRFTVTSRSEPDPTGTVPDG